MLTSCYTTKKKDSDNKHTQLWRTCKCPSDMHLAVPTASSD